LKNNGKFTAPKTLGIPDFQEFLGNFCIFVIQWRGVNAKD